MQLIDVDSPETWTDPLRNRVEELAERLADTTEYTNDLDVSFEEEDEIRALTAGRLMLAYHFTRLLDSEVEIVRRNGLVPLSSELITSRLDRALQEGLLTPDEHKTLLDGNALVSRPHDRREGQVCLVLSNVVFEEPRAVDRLLGRWGGEGIYFTIAGYSLEQRLCSFGRPSVVVAGIDLCERSHLVFPGVGKLLVGTSLGMTLRPADVFYYRSVHPEDVIGIWQPGSSEYDKHEGLPRA